MVTFTTNDMTFTLLQSSVYYIENTHNLGFFNQSHDFKTRSLVQKTICVYRVCNNICTNIVLYERCVLTMKSNKCIPQAHQQSSQSPKMNDILFLAYPFGFHDMKKCGHNIKQCGYCQVLKQSNPKFNLIIQILIESN